MITRLLDSVILIDHLNGVPEEVCHGPGCRANRDLGNHPGGDFGGSRTRKCSVGEDFLDQFHLLIIDKPIADLAASLRKSQGWKLPDAFQAALGIYHKIKLTTRNTKDFDPGRHDFAEIPY